MSDAVEDAKDWVEANKKFKDDEIITTQKKASVKTESLQTTKEESVEPEASSQYSIYGRGYAPTSATVKKLPSGCYDIQADSKCVFVTPTPKPSGLLLELPEMRSEQVIKVIENFWDSEADYKDGNEFVIGGAAYKAGVMIYGPPGAGKSCTIKIVSNKAVDRGGTVFYASVHPATVMNFLSNFALIEKNRKSIVILEDFDTLVNMHGESRYLEMLDSAKSINNALFIATTNYPERLDPRIYNRPGRFSHVIKIGYPTAAARTAYLKAILKNHRDVEYIVENTSGFSIDHLSALVNAVYREKKNMVDEIKRLRTLFNVPKSEDKTMGIADFKEE